MQIDPRRARQHKRGPIAPRTNIASSVDADAHDRKRSTTGTTSSSCSSARIAATTSTAAGCDDHRFVGTEDGREATASTPSDTGSAAASTTNANDDRSPGKDGKFRFNVTTAASLPTNASESTSAPTASGAPGFYGNQSAAIRNYVILISTNERE